MKSTPSSQDWRMAVVSDSLPYPRTSGDTARVGEMIDVMRQAGWKVHFIAPIVDDDRIGRACAGHVDFFHAYITLSHASTLRRVLRSLVKGLIRIKYRLAGIIGRRFVLLPPRDWWRRYPGGLDDFVLELHGRYGFDVVMVEYIWQYPACSKLPVGVCKVLDTHDLQYMRVQEFASRNLRFPLPITREEEARIFSLFDAVIAIQTQEAELIRGMAPDVEVLVVGASVAAGGKSAGIPLPARVLYVGNDNPVNGDGLRRFLEESWPVILREAPEAHLHVAGSVYLNFPGQRFDRVTFLKYVPDIDREYGSATIAINPVWIGTGLKIKTVEALAYGKPLVTTPKGTEGMNPAVARACCVAADESEFASEVVRLLKDPNLRQRLAESACDFAAQHLSRATVYAELLTFLDARVEGSRASAERSLTGGNRKVIR